MARPAQAQLTSPLISGGIFSQKTKRSEAKQKSSLSEDIRDYSELLQNLLIALTETVDRAFPNADFLSQVAGSHIEPDTKLSFVIRATFGLSQMSMKPTLISNYQQTLKKYLDNTQHNPAKKTEYVELLNIIKSHQNLVAATKGQQQIQAELERLTTLKLPSKTIDRRLKIEWVEPCIQKPIADLTTQVAKMLRSSERLQSPNDQLAGRSNSLAGLSRLMATTTKIKAAPNTSNKSRLPRNTTTIDQNQTVIASAA